MRIEAKLSLPGLDERAQAATARGAEAAVHDGSADIAYGYAECPLGRLLVATTARGLLSIAYVSAASAEESVLDELAARVSPRIVRHPESVAEIGRQLGQYFSGARTAFDMKIDWSLMRGFGRRVLLATARIPYGQVATYRDVAARAGNPKASRAAGNALSANPVPIVVPCHRVVRTGGALGGYTGGLDKKRQLLALEGAGP